MGFYGQYDGVQREKGEEIDGRAVIALSVRSLKLSNVRRGESLDR
jgi:hypothetical protein